MYEIVSFLSGVHNLDYDRADNVTDKDFNKEEDRNQLRTIFRQLSMLSQLGLSLVVPTLLCVFVCYWLTIKLGLGGWIYIPGFILGLGSSAMTAYKFYVSVMQKEKKEEEKKKPVSFNRHI